MPLIWQRPLGGAEGSGPRKIRKETFSGGDATGAGEGAYPRQRSVQRLCPVTGGRRSRLTGAAGWLAEIINGVLPPRGLRAGTLGAPP